jgi:hypothetical protein
VTFEPLFVTAKVVGPAFSRVAETEQAESDAATATVPSASVGFSAQAASREREAAVRPVARRLRCMVVLRCGAPG